MADATTPTQRALRAYSRQQLLVPGRGRWRLDRAAPEAGVPATAAVGALLLDAENWLGPADLPSAAAERDRHSMILVFEFLDFHSGVRLHPKAWSERFQAWLSDRPRRTNAPPRAAGEAAETR